MSDLPRVWENRVRFEETDRQGVVFYGNYVTFQDETVSQFFREIGYGYDQMEGRGWDVHVVNVDLDYLGQADFGDDLAHGVRIERIGESSMTFEYAAWRDDDRADDEGRELLAEGTVTHVAVDHATGDPVRIPDDFREAVSDYQAVPPHEP
jgi:acyl-CoA thioester hydrolase